MTKEQEAKLKLYAHWTRCTRVKCPEGRGGSCAQAGQPFPKDGVCIKKVYIALEDVNDVDFEAYEKKGDKEYF
jgi:hypothetical protein